MSAAPGLTLHEATVLIGAAATLVAIPGDAGSAVRARLAVPGNIPSTALLTRGSLRLGRRTVKAILATTVATVIQMSAHGLWHTSATLLPDQGVSVWDVQ
jgi:hypothetical protein